MRVISGRRRMAGIGRAPALFGAGLAVVIWLLRRIIEVNRREAAAA